MLGLFGFQCGQVFAARHFGQHLREITQLHLQHGQFLVDCQTINQILKRAGQ